MVGDFYGGEHGGEYIGEDECVDHLGCVEQQCEVGHVFCFE